LVAVEPIQAARRYYGDSYTTRFDSRVVELVRDGDRVGVVLAETYFYPSSGGQPHDLGRLGSAAVQDVTVRDADGAIVHWLDRTLEPGPVTGAIDLARRMDHMQQHTGQHILSQAYLRLADATTIGFHLGADYVSIDLDRGSLNEALHGQAFDLANEIVGQDVPVKAWFPDAAELATISLRKTPEVDGALRVVAVGDFDVSACGGTHVGRTGEIGLVHHLRSENLKRGTRVVFLTGDRARRDYTAKHRIVSQLSAALTCSAPELADAMARLQADLQTARRELARYREADLDREAAALALDGETASGFRLVSAAWTGRPVDDLKGLALRLTGAPDVVALLGLAGDRGQFVFGRPEAIALDLKPALQAAFQTIGGGKGGGARIVQGGGGPATLEQVNAALAAARAALPSA
jgi:alanyl-tRNA synthetase